MLNIKEEIHLLVSHVQENHMEKKLYHREDKNMSPMLFVVIAKGPKYGMNFRDLKASNSYSYSSETSIEEKPNEQDIDIIDSLKNFLPSTGNHLSRSVIPIGPRFQAEVPKWEATTNIKQYNNDYCLKWLGTQIWPMPFVCKTTAKDIGKGMLDSCLCFTPALVNCVEKHIGEV
ncbi:AT-rich interactive domain-containing protein [Trifolium repens]|nr:AT-rich interactive domain-containing protein [Trifolium repens]